MQNLSGNERFKAVSDLEVTQVDDGYVIYDEPNEKVHHLNPSAAIIYSVCDGTRTINDIRNMLTDLYGITDVPDLSVLFSDLEKAGLVCRAD